MEHHRITRKGRALDETLDMKKLIGLHVLSKNGDVVGRVSQIRIHGSKFFLEGIVVSRGVLAKPLYIDTDYISQLTHDSVMLSINPSVLVIGRRVISASGENIGRVRGVIRKAHSNDIIALRVRSMFHRVIDIPLRKVKSLGDVIVLENSYNVKKKYFWQSHR